MFKVQTDSVLEAWVEKNPLRAWRLSQTPQLTLEDAAAEIVCTRQAVSLWERGDYIPRHEKMVAIARTIGIEVSQLYEDWETWHTSRPAPATVVAA